MKSKSIPVLLFLLFSLEVFCQDNTVVVIQNEENLRFTVGNSYYSTTYKGIKNYMADLKHEEPELHSELLPEFENLTLKRNIGIGTAVGGFIIGSAFWISAFNDEMDATAQSPEDITMNSEATAIFAGIGIMTAAAIIAYIIIPDEDDYLSWVNHHNRINSKAAIQWRIGLNYIPSQQIGGTLTLRF